MYPVLIKIGPLTIRSYGVMMALAFLAARVVLSRELRRRALNPNIADGVVIAGLIGGIVGAKFYFLVEHIREVLDAPFEMIFSGSGLVWYGGFAGGAVGGLWFAWRQEIGPARMADLAAPALALGYVFGRLGCLLAGDDYGKATSLPWGMTFPEGMPPTTTPVHPTQIYEMVLSLVLFAAIWRWRRKARPDGYLFAVYGMLAGTERFVVEFWRVTTPALWGVTVAQVISLALILGGLGGVLALSGGSKRKATTQGR